MQILRNRNSYLERRHKPDFRDASRLGFAAQMKVRLAARCTPPPLAAGKCPPLTTLRDEIEDERKVAWVPSPPFSDLEGKITQPSPFPQYHVFYMSPVCGARHPPTLVVRCSDESYAPLLRQRGRVLNDVESICNNMSPVCSSLFPFLALPP